MKLTVNKKELLNAMKAVSRAICEKSSLEVLRNMKFKLENSTLEIVGYDLEFGIKTTISAETTDCGSFMLEPKLMQKMLTKLTGDVISLEIDEKYTLSISNGKSSYKIQASFADEYPELPEMNDFDSFTVKQSTLKSMIKQTIFAVATDTPRPILEGELFEIENGELNLVALDGVRLAMRTEKINTELNTQFSVHSKVMSELERLLKSKGEGECTISVTKKNVTFEVDNYTVHSKLLEGDTFPYRNAILKTMLTQVKIERKEMCSAVDRTTLLIDNKEFTPICCDFKEGCLKTTYTSSIGSVSDEIEIEKSGSDVTLAFNPKYLFESLNVISDDKIKLQMNGKNNFMQIAPLDGSSFLYFIWPVRLK